MRRRLRAAAVATAILLAVPSCSRGGEVRPSPSPTTTTIDALGAAIRGINATRPPLHELLDMIVGGAQAVDRGDELAAAGKRREGSAARAAIDAAITSRDRGDGGVLQALDAFGKAVDALEQAGKAPDLAPEQRKALQDVARAARLEFAADTRFVNATRSAWPAYVAVSEAHRTWAVRARAGWYRNDREAGDAYAVLVVDQRPRLDAARAAFQKADAERKAATDRTTKAIAAARGVLAGLR